jgi:hypothetical protein
MRITKIEMEGRDGYYAIASRKRGSESIEVEILLPDYHETFTIVANDDEARFEMGRRLCEKLEEPSNNNLLPYEYAMELQRLAGL